MKDIMLIIPYTPMDPMLAEQEDRTFKVVVERYLPNNEQPEGEIFTDLNLLPKEKGITGNRL